MARAGLLILAALVAGCVSVVPLDPIALAGQACHEHLTAIIESGECDHVADLDNCPAYTRAMSECMALLDAAKRVQ